MKYIRLIKLEYIPSIFQIIVIFITIFLLISCKTNKTITTYSKIDTTYRDTIIYNIIEKDSTSVKTNIIYKDSTIVKDSIVTKIKVRITDTNINIDPLEDSIGLAKGKAWVKNGVLHLEVFQLQDTIAIKLDSALQTINKQDSIITTLKAERTDKHKNGFMHDLKFIVVCFLIIVVLIALIKFFK